MKFTIFIVISIVLISFLIKQFYHDVGPKTILPCVVYTPLSFLHWIIYYDFGRSFYRSVVGYASMMTVGPEDINTIDVEIDVASGRKISRIYKPSTINENEKSPVLLWIHGGGFVLGGITYADGHVRRISKETNMIVVSVGYGLAPENKFPIPFYDCFKTLRWVYNHIEEYGGDKTKIAVAGESAGGNLASVVVLENARSPNPVPLCAQGLVVPIVLAEVLSNSMSSNRNGYMLSTDGLVTFLQLYARSWEDMFDTRLSPLLAPLEDLNKLPPGIILTAEKDILRDQGEAYANKLRSANVNITSFRANGTIHGFFARDMDYGQESLEIFSATLNHFCRKMRS